MPLRHLDVAACGVVSQQVLQAEIDHLRAEATRGGYVAELEAAPRMDAGRAALASMVGLAGSDVAFGEGGGASFAALLDAWPLETGARIGIVPSEYGGNARVLADRAARRGWQLIWLEVDDLGRVQGVPAGLAWEASVVVDGVKRSRMTCAPGRTRSITDLAANVSKLTGTHDVGVRLELVAV